MFDEQVSNKECIKRALVNAADKKKKKKKKNMVENYQVYLVTLTIIILWMHLADNKLLLFFLEHTIDI